MHCSSLSPPWLTCNYPQRATPRKTELLFKYSVNLVMLRFLTPAKVEKVFMVMFVSSLFFFTPWNNRQAGGCVFVSLRTVSQISNSWTHTHTQHCERLVLTEQPVGRRADEMQPWMKKKGKKEQQKAPGCALVRGAPREKDEAVEGSYSRLRTPAQEQVTHMADA